MSAVAEDLLRREHLVGESSEPVRRQELADEIGLRQARLKRLLESRNAENLMAPADRLEVETNIARARAAIEPLEAELARLVREEDDRAAAERARLKAEREAARPGLEKRRNAARERYEEALSATELELDHLVKAIKQVLDLDKEIAGICEELDEPHSQRGPRSRIAARIGARLRIEVGINDVSGPYLNARHQELAEAPLAPDRRSNGAQAGKPASEQASGKGSRSATPVASMPAWGDAFLDALRAGATPDAAAKTAGVSRATVYRERKTNRGLAAAWDTIVARGAGHGG